MGSRRAAGTVLSRGEDWRSRGLGNSLFLLRPWLVRVASWGAVLLSIALGAPAAATVVRDASIEELARDADVVIRGRVAGLETRLVDEGRRVMTLVEVVATECYGGGCGETTEVLIPGGAHGEIVQRISGLPGFAEDDDVILFLKRRPGGARSSSSPRFSLMSMGLGAFVVLGEEAVRQTQGLRVIRGRLDPPVAVPLEERRVSLSVLERMIRKVFSGDER